MVNHQDNNKNLSEYITILKKRYPLNNKVLFVQPPQFIIDSFNYKVAKAKGCYAFPPTGLQCLIKALSNRNLEMNILDLNYQLLKHVIENESYNYLNWLELLDEHINKNHPSIVVITCISIYTDVFKPEHPLTRLLEHLHNRDDSIVIIGGPIATNEYKNYLMKDLCHFVIKREGENKIKFLFEQLFHSWISPWIDNTRPTNSIHFKFKNKIEETNGENDIVSLEGNLVDTYKYISIEDYNNVGSLNPFSRMAGQDKKFTGIQLNRGCRANCKFCGVVKFMGKKFRQYNISDLLEEMNYLIIKREIRHFEILDDDFLGYGTFNNNCLSLLKKMVNLHKKYGITWAAGNGLIAASLNEKTLNLMRDSGCIGFRIGIESGNAKMLKQMRKPINLSLIRKTSKILQNYPEMFIAGNFIIGLFGEETFGEMLDTFKFANEINLDWVAYTTFQFTSEDTILAENLSLKKTIATDFIPTKDTSSRELSEPNKVISGPEIFNIPKDSIPSQEQIKHIWFTFNLISNYINNKNLKPNGNPAKFVSWIEAVYIVYPENPYMPLFAGIGHVLLGNKELADKCVETAKQNILTSKYWKTRFDQFCLMNLITNFPKNSKEAYNMLELTQNKYSKWTNGAYV